MGRVIVLQPNGLFAEWSTIVDSVISIHNSPEDLILERVKEFTEEETKRVNGICRKLKTGNISLRSMTWGDVVERTEELYDKDSKEMNFLRDNNLLKGGN